MVRFTSRFWFFYTILLFILTSDVAILFDVPVARQILGFLLFLLIPGLLLILIFNLEKLELIEKGILVVGLSVSYIYFFGLMVNFLLPFIGCKAPLATIPLLASFNCTYIFCLVIIWFQKKDPFSSFRHFVFNRIDRVIIIIIILLPACMITAIFTLNSMGYNQPLIALILFIAAFILSIGYLKNKISTEIYPIILAIIAFSFLSIFMLRFPYMWGNDVHSEYGLAFYSTMNLLRWQSGYSTLSNILSVTLLPTILQSICSVAYLELFFKFIYVFICIVTPLTVFCLARKYIGDYYAFFAGVFYITQFGFLFTVANPRTNIAILFCALTFFVVFCDRLNIAQKGLLSTIFLASITVSHYSTAYIFCFIILFAIIGTWFVRRKFQFPVSINPLLGIIFFAFIFLWYYQITEGGLFQRGVTFVEKIATNMDTLFSSEYQTTEEAKMLLVPTFKNQTLSMTHWIVNWGSFLFMGIGILYSFWNYQKLLKLTNSIKKKANFILSRIEIELLLAAFICTLLLGALTIYTVISEGYDSGRLFGISAIILSVFLVIGIFSIINSAQTASTFISRSVDLGFLVNVILVLLVVVYGLFTLGVPYQIFGISQSHLNSEDINYRIKYIHEMDGAAAIWLNAKSADGTEILVPGYTGASLISQGHIFNERIIRGLTFFAKDKDQRYIFYSSIDIDQKYFIRESYYKVYSKLDLTENQQKIYSNKGAEIFLFR